MARFGKGNPGGPGRPEGAKNKNAMRPILWWNKFEEELDTLPKPERLGQIKWAIEQLMTKIPVLPTSPGDSSDNAEKAFELMNNLAPIPDKVIGPNESSD